ncbi:MAG: biopolymer transporter ExbD [Nitrospirae bacterium]|nr:biopolymer transporter ExbD [Nitrospirota bacterium]
MIFREDHDGEEDLVTGINIIPLVDISLVLLIIFMVTTTIILSPSLRMDLPKARTAEPSPLTRLTVSMGKNGELFLNDQATTEEALRQLFHQKAEESPAPQVVINADRGVEHGAVIHLIDLARAAGLTRFAFMVEKE